MRNISDIPDMPDRATRLAEVTVDCYGQDEELSAFEVYLTDALRLPFAAAWRDPDEPGHGEPVTVLAVADAPSRRGIKLQVRRQSGKERRVLAEHIWVEELADRNAMVLEDYRAWVKQGGLE